MVGTTYSDMKRVPFQIGIGLVLFLLLSCTREQLVDVLDDAARDTYVQQAKKERRENLDNPSYQAPESYDEYQRNRP